jgi:hypothetical protein
MCRGFSFAFFLLKEQNNIINKLNYKNMFNPEGVPIEEPTTPPVSEPISDEETLRQELEPELRDTVYKLISRFSEKTGIKVEEENLPRVTLAPNRRTPWGNKKPLIPTCSGMGNINITEDNIGSKTAVPEEISHHIRGLLRPKEEKDVNAEEFFGFLGTRILYPKFERKLPFAGDEEYKHYIKDIEAKLADPKLEDEAKRAFLKQQITEAENHYYGYKYAHGLKINKITDWQKLYAMPDQEVRKRFFTDKPDYSGL